MSLTVSPDGLGPLRLGMTYAQAKATGTVGAFDDPLRTRGACGHAEAARPYQIREFVALFELGKLVRFYVFSSRLRTPQGIGNDSPVAMLSSIPGTRVESPHPYDELTNPTRTNIDITNGDVGYQFTIKDGKVLEWSVGTKDGLSLIEGCV